MGLTYLIVLNLNEGNLFYIILEQLIVDIRPVRFKMIVTFSFMKGMKVNYAFFIFQLVY